jgi:hypothetical protein
MPKDRGVQPSNIGPVKGAPRGEHPGCVGVIPQLELCEMVEPVRVGDAHNGNVPKVSLIADQPRDLVQIRWARSLIRFGQNLLGATSTPTLRTIDKICQLTQIAPKHFVAVCGAWWGSTVRERVNRNRGPSIISLSYIPVYSVKRVNALQIGKAFTIRFQYIQEVANGCIAGAISDQHKRATTNQVEEKARCPTGSHVGLAVFRAG